MHSTRKSDPDQTTPLLESENRSNIQLKHSYRKAVFFILFNDFIQRSSFYGLQAVLILYVIQVLLYEEDTATIIFHGMMMIAFFSPLIGAFVADVHLGRFKTLVCFSILCIIGNILLSVASVPEFLPMRPLSMLGIILIAITIGTISPVCHSFGGDQFKCNQTKELTMYFSVLFVCLKMAKLAGTFVSPILRAEVHCFGESTCFPLTYGIPTLLIIFSLIIFLIGYPYYKINPASGNIMCDVTKCIAHAVVQKFKTRKTGLKKQHWLDYADDKYEIQVISDVKSLLSILTMFLPVPVFWALSEQQGSRWTLQATQMNNSIGDYKIKPDQMQIFNAMLGIIIVPFLDYFIYPLLKKCNLLIRLLQRMTVGGLFLSFAFIIAGFLQLSIERTFASYDIKSVSDFHIIKGLPLQNLQLYAMNCSLHKESNTHLESKTNQIIRCLYNNGTMLYIQDYEKFINRTQYEINNSVNLHNSSFPISRKINDITYKFSAIKDNSGTLEFQPHVLFSSCSLSILLQIPQYFLLTTGEMMFHISSTEFAYSQAPKTMKTILPALLLVNNGIGNLIVMVVTKINLFQRQSYEFFFYAIMLAIVIFIFELLARNYKYKKQDGE